MMKPQSLDTYLDLCTEVYDLSKPNPPEDAYNFYRSYATNARGPILEPMCGTGRFLLPLLEEGFDIQGFDASDHMLAALQTKAKLKGLKPNIWKAFAENLKNLKTYNLIFIPSGSFCLMTDLKIAKIALKNFYDHLEADGILLFEIETLKDLPSPGIWRGSVWYRPDGKKIILSFLASLDEENVCRSIAKYELVDNNKIVQTEIEEYKIRFYDFDVLSDMLSDVGFRNIRIIKTFDNHSKPGINNEATVYECKK